MNDDELTNLYEDVMDQVEGLLEEEFPGAKFALVILTDEGNSLISNAGAYMDEVQETLNAYKTLRGGDFSGDRVMQ